VPADAAAIVELGRTIDRDQIATTATFRALLERPAPPATERRVAEVGGRVVAWAPSRMYESKSGWLWIGVDATCRRRGIGGEVYRRIESRLAGLGATRLDTTPNDDEGRAFLLARGFESANAEAPTRTDVRVVPLSAVIDYADALFRSTPRHATTSRLTLRGRRGRSASGAPRRSTRR